MAYNIGDTVPSFTLPRAEGGDVTVDPAGSTATVVVFTSNHCPYALAWHDRLNAVTRDYSDRGVNVVQINANDESRYPLDSTEASAARVENGEFSGPYLRDLTQEVAREFGAAKTPDVYVIDSRGRLAYHGAPDENHEEEASNAAWVRSALDELSAGRTVTVPETQPVGCGIKWFVDESKEVS
jgi:peroxiredoxin